MAKPKPDPLKDQSYSTLLVSLESRHVAMCMLLMQAETLCQLPPTVQTVKQLQAGIALLKERVDACRTAIVGE